MTVKVTARGAERWKQGHPWIYRSDVADVHAAPGDLVRVTGTRGRVVGHALFSDRSEITLRMIAAGAEPPPASFVRERLEDALRFRESLHLDATACRRFAPDYGYTALAGLTPTPEPH